MACLSVPLLVLVGLSVPTLCVVEHPWVHLALLVESVVLSSWAALAHLAENRRRLGRLCLCCRYSWRNLPVRVRLQVNVNDTWHVLAVGAALFSRRWL